MWLRAHIAGCRPGPRRSARRDPMRSSASWPRRHGHRLLAWSRFGRAASLGPQLLHQSGHVEIMALLPGLVAGDLAYHASPNIDSLTGRSDWTLGSLERSLVGALPGQLEHHGAVAGECSAEASLRVRKSRGPALPERDHLIDALNLPIG